MRILVTGGTGFIGRASVAALLEAGHDVRVLARDPGRAQAAFRELGPVDVAVGEPVDGATVRRALEGRDALVHAAAVYSYVRRDTARMLADTPALAAAVLGAALAAGTPRVIDISTAGVFTPDVPRIDESTPLAREGEPVWGDPYLQAKVLAERQGRDLAAQGLPRVTIHPTMVVGPEDRGPGTSGGLLLQMLRARMFPRARLGWVDVRDVATAIVAALDAPLGSAYILCRGVETLAGIGERLDRLTGRRHLRLITPRAVTRAVARINDGLGAPMRSLPAAPSLEYMLRCPPVIDGTHAAQQLRIRYRDLDQTLEDALRWWAANGILERRLAGRLAAAVDAAS
jgi:nucleoside-diphosphate-sugar epimerase